MTLVRDNGKLLPLRQRAAGKSLLVQYPPFRRQRPLLLIILCDNVRSDDGRVLELEVRKRAPEARVMYLDPRIAAARSEALFEGSGSGATGGSGGICRALCRTHQDGSSGPEEFRVSAGLDGEVIRRHSCPCERQNCSSGYGDSLSHRGLPRNPKLHLHILERERI